MTVSSYHIGKVIQDSRDSNSTRKSNKRSSIWFSAVSSATTLQSILLSFPLSLSFEGKKKPQQLRIILQEKNPQPPH